MEMFQLRYFVAAARLRHFTRAAEECCVSQPSLSLQIANLERELGARLFYREKRGARLTDAGEAALRHAERILAEEEAAKRAVQEVVGLRRGRLSLWTLPTPAQHLLPPLLTGFRRDFPDIEMMVHEAVPARAVAEAVADGRADTGIVHAPYQVAGLAERVLLVEELALVVPDAHRFASRGEVGLHEAAGEDFIGAPEGATEAHPLYAACLGAGFVPRIACMSGSGQGMQALAAAGLGITLLPRMAIHPPAGARVVELAAPRPTRTLLAVWRADGLSHCAAAFLERLRPASREPERAG